MKCPSIISLLITLWVEDQVVQNKKIKLKLNYRPEIEKGELKF